MNTEQKRTASTSGGQSGDLQGLANEAEADSESVQELLEEGQTLEAEAIEGVENAPDPDVAEVTTRQVPENDVPQMKTRIASISGSAIAQSITVQ